MTDTITTSRTRPDRPVSGRRGGTRLLRSIAYDVRLVVIGSQTMADAVTGEDRTAAGRLAQLTPSQRKDPGAGELFGHGVLSSVLGALSWFLVMLLVMAVVRGPFYELVEDGPFGPGTWGGPAKAGAWATHAAISVPIIAVLLLAFRGIAWLHEALIRRLYGLAGRWVLPATITVCAGGVMLTWSWIQQL